MKYYFYNQQDKLFSGFVESDTQPENSTTVSPFDRNGSVKIGTWFDTDKNAWQEPATKSTVQQELNAQVMAQLASMKTQLATQAYVNAKLMKTVASLQTSSTSASTNASTSTSVVGSAKL